MSAVRWDQWRRRGETRVVSRMDWEGQDPDTGAWNTREERNRDAEDTSESHEPRRETGWWLEAG